MVYVKPTPVILMLLLCNMVAWNVLEQKTERILSIIYPTEHGYRMSKPMMDVWAGVYKNISFKLLCIDGSAIKNVSTLTAQVGIYTKKTAAVKMIEWKQ